jgi:hypothetical protein
MIRYDAARPGWHPGTGASSTQSWLIDGRDTTPDRERRQQARAIHALGPRPFDEMLREIERDPTNMRRIVRRYAELDPATVAALGGRDWVEPCDLLREVPA